MLKNIFLNKMSTNIKTKQTSIHGLANLEITYTQHKELPLGNNPLQFQMI